MSAASPRGRLSTKILAAALAPTVVVLAVLGVLAHATASRELEAELGRRLATAAAAAAQMVQPFQLQAIGPGDEATATAANLRRRIERARDDLDVRRVVLLARDLTGRGDTEGRIALGARAHEFSTDRAEVERAAGGRPTASPLFQTQDGILRKRAYARVGDPAAGFVAVEASADYLVSLRAFRRWLVLASAIGLGALAILSIGLARAVTGPLARLADAADRIGRGDLATAVAARTHDEVGLLASRLDEMRAALRARDERLQMMLAGIAHEVRNPLGGLELYAGLLRDALAGQPERLAEVARIEREVAHLKAVVNDFLEYARRPAPERTSFPLRPLLDEVVEVVGGGDIVVDAPALDVRADRGQLRRALVNLARNARAAAGPGGRVTMTAAREAGGSAGVAADGARVVVEVRDSGPGVPDELREQIFTPFFTTREKGTGLGLAFVREIARDHGGDVAVGRAPEGGACFRLSVPAG